MVVMETWESFSQDLATTMCSWSIQPVNYSLEWSKFVQQSWIWDDPWLYGSPMRNGKQVPKGLEPFSLKISDHYIHWYDLVEACLLTNIRSVSEMRKMILYTEEADVLMPNRDLFILIGKAQTWTSCPRSGCGLFPEKVSSLGANAKWLPHHVARGHVPSRVNFPGREWLPFWRVCVALGVVAVPFHTAWYRDHQTKVMMDSNTRKIQDSSTTLVRFFMEVTNSWI